MTKSTIGWIWVAGQTVLLLSLMVIPSGDAWPTGRTVGVIGALMFLGGLAFFAIATLNLGASFTPTPVPVSSGRLKTTGLYSLMRHPIYTGVFITISGVAVASGSMTQVIMTLATFVFFDRKAAWEEQQLRETYSGYADYASRTAKFFPGTR